MQSDAETHLWTEKQKFYLGFLKGTESTFTDATSSFIFEQFNKEFLENIANESNIKFISVHENIPK